MSALETIVRRWSAISRSLSQFTPALPPHARRRLRLRLERLEDRTVLSSFNLPVTSLADTGPGTLRSAITEADAGSAAQTYNIKFKVSGTIALESALPDLSESMNLSGPGASRLTVQRDPRASSFFGIFVVDPGVAVKISGMTIAHGFSIYLGSGAGIDNAGTLSVSHTTISDNSSDGGIDNIGTLAVSHSTIAENAAEDGGGIHNTGSLTVSFTTISHNYAVGGGYVAGYGGGIDNTGMLTVKHSTIFANNIPVEINGPPVPIYPEGGGVYNGTTGTVSLSRTTISGNSAAYSGGGIGNTGTLTLSHTTISGNSAFYSGDGINNTGTLTVSNTTISRNTGGSGNVGGGINNSGPLTVSHTIISGNTGGIGSLGAGINNTGPLTISLSTISGNTDARGSTGGGINNTGPLTVSRTTISRNSATTGGGLYNSGGAQAEVDYSTINDPAGGGIVNNNASMPNYGSTVRLKKTVVDGVFYKQYVY